MNKSKLLLFLLLLTALKQHTGQASSACNRRIHCAAGVLLKIITR
jgi:hypothetical protein